MLISNSLKQALKNAPKKPSKHENTQNSNSFLAIAF
jgi:hypothetical protein